MNHAKLGLKFQITNPPFFIKKTLTRKYLDPMHNKPTNINHTSCKIEK
jgi:hypothetical protein